MPKKCEWVVRVVQPTTEGDSIEKRMMSARLPDLWIECLRYAGLLRQHEDMSLEDRECFDILPPEYAVKNKTTESWADMNAARMKTFGINACSAPRT